MYIDMHACLYKIRKKMKTESKDKVSGKAKHTIARGLYEYVTVQKFQQIQKTCKGVRKELPRATAIHGTEEGWVAHIIIKGE